MLKKNKKNFLKKLLTLHIIFARITLAADEERLAADNMERYRRGHNEAVLKTVCPQGHVGSNPTLSAEATKLRNNEMAFSLGEVPKRLKGHPWKGCRSLIAARGFKSLLLRLEYLQRDAKEP